jgi:hypothetical protein
VQFNIRFDARPGTGYGSPLPKRPGKTMLLFGMSALLARKRDGSEIEQNPQQPPTRLARAKLVTPATAAAYGDEWTILPSRTNR